MIIENMRTLATQVRLRRLIRSFAEAHSRLLAPSERPLAGTLTDRLQALNGDVQDAWRRESLASRPGEALDGFVADSLRSAGLAIAGLAQDGSDLELLREDFERAALPLEIFLRGLDAEPALERSA
jgi:hypothetical protein